jgi:hypothetical protein
MIQEFSRLWSGKGRERGAWQRNGEFGRWKCAPPPPGPEDEGRDKSSLLQGPIFSCLFRHGGGQSFQTQKRGKGGGRERGLEWGLEGEGIERIEGVGDSNTGA